MTGKIEISVSEPAICSSADLLSFAEMVRGCGEVAERSLDAGLKRAFRLVFLRRNGQLIGTAGLKRPRSSYRLRVAAAADVGLASGEFPFEFGWVVVSREERRLGHFRTMARAAMAVIADQGVFATSSVANASVLRVLGELGFQPMGCLFVGSAGREMLLLARSRTASVATFSNDRAIEDGEMEPDLSNAARERPLRGST